MPELKDYYNKWRETLLILCILCWIILSAVFCFINEAFSNLLGMWIDNPNIEWVNQGNEQILYYIFDLLIDFAAPTTITVILFSVSLNYINQNGWKKKFPQYDVNGEWADITTYIKGLNGRGWINLEQKNVPSPVQIKQTCQTIEVLPSIGENFVWHSLSADWDNNNNLKILYEVEYYGKLQKEGYPEKRIGYESMRIDMNKLSTDNRPCKMVGKFWHCISDDGKPIYMGDVVYERKGDHK